MENGNILSEQRKKIKFTQVSESISIALNKKIVSDLLLGITFIETFIRTINTFYPYCE